MFIYKNNRVHVAGLSFAIPDGCTADVLYILMCWNESIYIFCLHIPKMYRVI